MRALVEHIERGVNMIELIGRGLKQWELGRQVKITSEEPFNEVHFSQVGDGIALVVETNDIDGVIVADIPNILLQSSRQLKASLVLKKDSQRNYIERARFDIQAETKPSDYVYTETEIKTYESLVERVEELEKRVVSDEQIEKAVKKYLGEHSIAKIGNVTLLASKWVGDNNLFSQVVDVEGATENSQVDLTPSVEQLAIFYEKDITFVTENENGVVTVYVIGQKPLLDYTIQVTITEVEYE